MNKARVMMSMYVTVDFNFNSTNIELENLTDEIDRILERNTVDLDIDKRRYNFSYPGKVTQ